MRDVNYEKLTKRTIALFTRERGALVDNNVEILHDCAVQKVKLLDELDMIEKMVATKRSVSDLGQYREQLESVQAIIARRGSENEQLKRTNRV